MLVLALALPACKGPRTAMSYDIVSERGISVWWHKSLTTDYTILDFNGSHGSNANYGFIGDAGGTRFVIAFTLERSDTYVNGSHVKYVHCDGATITVNGKSIRPSDGDACAGTNEVVRLTKLENDSPGSRRTFRLLFTSAEPAFGPIVVNFPKVGSQSTERHPSMTVEYAAKKFRVPNEGGGFH